MIPARTILIVVIARWLLPNIITDMLTATIRRHTRQGKQKKLTIDVCAELMTSLDAGPKKKILACLISRGTVSAGTLRNQLTRSFSTIILDTSTAVAATHTCADCKRGRNRGRQKLTRTKKIHRWVSGLESRAATNHLFIQFIFFVDIPRIWNELDINSIVHSFNEKKKCVYAA